MGRTKDVFDIAVDTFGEDNVDFIGTKILIHWSKITITNEINIKHDIYDLYAKITIDYDGKYIFTEMIRSTFTPDEIDKGYVHSHLPTAKNIVEFEIPCFGSGPIMNTLSSLKDEYNEDLWRLFFIELDRYVRVESIYGGPFIRMSSIGSKGCDQYKLFVSYNIPDIKENYYYDEAKNIFDYMKSNNRIINTLKSITPISLGSVNDAIKSLTKEAMIFYNNISIIKDNAEYEKIFKVAYMDDGSILTTGNNYERNRIRGIGDFSFKGKRVEFKIIKKKSQYVSRFLVLNENIASFLISLIIKDIYDNIYEYIGTKQQEEQHTA